MLCHRTANAHQRRVRASLADIASARMVAELVHSDLVDAAGSDHDEEIDDPKDLETSSFASNCFDGDDA